MVPSRSRPVDPSIQRSQEYLERPVRFVSKLYLMLGVMITITDIRWVHEYVGAGTPEILARSDCS